MYFKGVIRIFRNIKFTFEPILTSTLVELNDEKKKQRNRLIDVRSIHNRKVSAENTNRVRFECVDNIVYRQKVPSAMKIQKMF